MWVYIKSITIRQDLLVAIPEFLSVWNDWSKLSYVRMKKNKSTFDLRDSVTTTFHNTLFSIGVKISELHNHLFVDGLKLKVRDLVIVRK